MARVFFTILAVSVALAAVMALPYPEGEDAAATTTVAPAVTDAPTTAAPPGSNNNNNNMGFNCTQYQEQCGSNNNALTNSTGGMMSTPAPQPEICTQQAFTNACQTFSGNNFGNINQNNITNVQNNIPGMNNTNFPMQPPSMQAPGVPAVPSMQTPPMQIPGIPGAGR